MDEPLILIANPGSASRKYALYQAGQRRAGLHFEITQKGVICTLEKSIGGKVLDLQIEDINNASEHALPILRENNILSEHEHIDRIGLRVVAPSSFFLEDHVVDNNVEGRLASLAKQAPIHINATLHELHRLRMEFPNIPVVGISDSNFHITKPDHAWNYGLPLDDSDTHEIKRFGYHGISIASVATVLKTSHTLQSRMIVAHIGSGVSITALFEGKSIDTTMGYSPLDGVVMATRSGSIDHTAISALKSALRLDDDQIDEYLNRKSGLLGLGGSADIPELLRREADNDHKAQLALQIYVCTIQKAIGQMTAALGGVDAIVFTGVVGERSAIIRRRILSQFHYLGFTLDHTKNDACLLPAEQVVVSEQSSKPVYVIPSMENEEMARRTAAI